MRSSSLPDHAVKKGAVGEITRSREPLTEDRIRVNAVAPGLLMDSNNTYIVANHQRCRARVLIILGHPRPDSFCGALAAAYGKAAEDHGLDVKTLVLADLEFDLNVSSTSVQEQPLEPDLQMARTEISQAAHLVFIYPIWWGMIPYL